MSRETVEITGVHIHATADDAGWVRISSDDVVPSRLAARFFLANPDMRVDLTIAVDPSGRPKVDEITVAPVTAAVSSALLRSIPVASLVREAIARAAVHRSQEAVPIAPSWRGRPIPEGRIEQVAEVYRQALAAGRRSPSAVVAATLGYSAATTARDLRRARAMGLLEHSHQSVRFADGEGGAR